MHLQGDEKGNELNTVVFKLNVTCKRRNGIKDTATMRMVGGELENEKSRVLVSKAYVCVAVVQTMHGRSCMNGPQCMAASHGQSLVSAVF